MVYLKKINTPLWTTILFILVAGIIVYLNSFNGDFVYDDERHILLNPDIRSLFPLWRSMIAELNVTRPLIGLTFAINYAIGEYNPFSYHLFNLIIHLISSLAIFGIIRRLCLNKDMPAWIQQYAIYIAGTSALLWVVHPLNVQAVTYITQRFQSMMGMFYFLTVYASIRYFQNDEKRYWMYLAILCAICGSATKQDIIVMPFVVLALDRLFFSTTFKQVWQQHKWLYAGLMVAFGMLIYLNQLGPSRGFAGFGGSFLIPYNYALTQMKVILMYIGLALLPLNPVFDYRLPVVNSITQVIPQTILIFSLLGLTIFLLTRRNKFAFFGVWFFFGLAVTSSFFPIADSICEYRMYVPLVAITTLVSLAVWKLISLKNIPIPLGMIIIAFPACFYSYKTIDENSNFSSQMRLWEVVAQKRPGNARAWNNYGITVERAGNIAKAHEMYRKAYEVDPSYIGAVHSLARLEFNAKNYDQALKYLAIAIRLSPHFSSPYMMVGKIFLIQGKDEEAEKFFKKALERDPYETETYNHYGVLLLQNKRPKEALAMFDKAALYEPRNPEFYFNLGTAYAVLEMPQEAKLSFMHALKLNPSHDGARHNLEVLKKKYNIQ